MPGRRRAVPPETEAGADDAAPPVIGGAHSRPPLSGPPRAFTGETPSGGAHARPSARPASRAPSLPSGPVLLPPAERPSARPPGARRADKPTVVGPAPAHAPAGRRIAARNEPIPSDTAARPRPTPARTRAAAPPAPAPAAPVEEAPAPAAPVEAAPAQEAPAQEAPAQEAPVEAPPVEPTRVLAEALAPEALAPEALAPAAPARRARPEPRPRPARDRRASRERTRTRGWLRDRDAQPDEPIGDEPAAKVEPAPASVPAPELKPEPVRKPEPEPVAKLTSAERTPRLGLSERIERVVAGPAPVVTSGVWTWVLVLLLACGGVLASRLNNDLPDLLRQASGTVIAVGLALGLAVRTGGRPVWAGGLSAAVAVAAYAGDWETLRSGASVGTGVMAACLAIMVTVPAATFAIAIREVLIASAVAWVGAFGVLAFGEEASPRVDVERFDYAVLGLALVGAFALVYRLGAGLHGLGRRGYVVIGSALVMLVFALAYSEALAQWGDRDLVGSVDDFRDSVRDALGAVPHPIVAALGYPALLWGVFMRARRRQGWWVCAFGIAATAPIATRLIVPDLSAKTVALGGLYSLLIGIVLGYAVIRLEQSFTGTHGRRARRDEEAVAHRPEPGRSSPLH